MPYDIDNEIEVDNDNQDRFAGFGKETTLELVEADDGRLLLRDAADQNEAPLMTIDFSDKLKELLGSDTQAIGQHMTCGHSGDYAKANEPVACACL